MRTALSGTAGILAAVGLAAASWGQVAPQPEPAKPPKPVVATPVTGTDAAPVQPDPSNTPEVTEWKPDAVDMLRKEAGQLMELARNMDVRKFMFSTTWLPVISEPRVVYFGSEGKAITNTEFDALPEGEREAWKPREFDGYAFYYTKYGSPLAYMRPLDLASDAIGGLITLRGKKILDYGYGTIGHLRLLASQNADVTGVDVDPMLKALYSHPDDQGEVPGVGLDDIPEAGHLKLVHGLWPGDKAVASAVGGSYDLIISKNTLKNGFINPEHPVDKRMMVDLSVPQDEFVSKLVGALKPGGVLIIYNICPPQKPEGEGYIPWADGRCPFPREMLEKAGFDVLEYNKDDTEFVRRMGHSLDWDKGLQPMDLERDVRAEYTLLKKVVTRPAKPARGK